MSKKASEGLVVIAGFGPVAEDLADVAVGPLVAFIAVVGGVRGGVGHLHLRGTVLRVMEVEAVADVAEQPWGRLLLHRFLVKTVIVIQLARVIPIEGSGRHFLQFVLEFLVLPLQVDDDRIQEVNLTLRSLLVLQQLVQHCITT